MLLTLLVTFGVETFGFNLLRTGPVINSIGLLQVDTVDKFPLAFWLCVLNGGSTRLFAQVFVKQSIVVFLDNDLHSSSKVINVPIINLVDIVLLQHHWVMDFPRIVQNFERIRSFNLKWLVDNLVEILSFGCDKVGLFLLLGRLAHILLALLLLTTKEVIVLAAY